MGVYMYRVTAKTVKLETGELAHVAKFAYKPYNSFFSGDRDNAKMHFRSGCVASENMDLKSNFIVTLDERGETGTLYGNPTGLKVFIDDYTFGSEKMPRLSDVRKAGKYYALEN